MQELFLEGQENYQRSVRLSLPNYRQVPEASGRVEAAESRPLATSARASASQWGVPRRSKSSELA